MINLGEVVLLESDVGRLLFPAWDNVMVPNIEAFGVWEPVESAWIREHVAPGSACLDIGANVGYHALTIAQSIGESGSLIAIEPDPLNFELLRLNLAANGFSRVECINSAAGDYDGKAEFTRDSFNAGDHRSYRRKTAPESAIMEVPIARVDELIGDTPIDFVLCDTQSFDHRVIQGMSRTIERHRPSMLVEFWTAGLEELGEDPVDVISYYQEIGYSLSVLDHPGLPANPSPQEFVELTDSVLDRYVTLVLEPTGLR